MQPGRAVEMTDAGKTKENQTQVSLRFPRPLEIAARFPHSHRPGEARKSGKRKPRFPLSPWRLLQLQNQSRKETRPRIAPLPPSGSFFNEKMLVRLSDTHFRCAFAEKIKVETLAGNCN